MDGYNEDVKRVVEILKFEMVAIDPALLNDDDTLTHDDDINVSENEMSDEDAIGTNSDGSDELESSGSEVDLDELEDDRKPPSASFANSRRALIAAYSDRPETFEVAKTASKKQNATAGFKNRQRVMVLSSRGITHRYRHLLKDMVTMLPHGRKENKFDDKGNLMGLNELADLESCNNCIFFEVRKKQDLFMWMSKTPHGPSVKFYVQNGTRTNSLDSVHDVVHTMDELKMIGNCLKGSRPLLSFDASFDKEPHYQLLKKMLQHIFNTPKGHRKSKPFFDHVFSFSILDGRIWFRHYQITESNPHLVKNKDLLSSASSAPTSASSDSNPIATNADGSILNDVQLVEIGPRFVMTTVRIFDGSFGGRTLYQNPLFVSPNTVRAMQKRKAAKKYVDRVKKTTEHQVKKELYKREKTVLDTVDEVFQ